VEKFIVARRLMYWQVYLHKTVLSAENLLIHILRRAKSLAEQGHALFAGPSLETFLKHRYTTEDFMASPELLDTFAQLEDYDIFYSIKMWTKSEDKVLSLLSSNLINRHLPKIEIQSTPFSKTYIEDITRRTREKYKLSDEEISYFVFTDEVANNAYNPAFDKILMLYPQGVVTDITKSSDQINTELLSRTITKYFLCYPKDI